MKKTKRIRKTKRKRQRHRKNRRKWRGSGMGKRRRGVTGRGKVTVRRIKSGSERGTGKDKTRQA